MTDRLTFEIKSITDDSNPNGTFQAVLSDSTLDRDGEIIDAYAGQVDASLPSSIPIYSDHETYTLRSIVGRAVPSYNAQGQLVVKGYFFSGQWAQEVRQMLIEGVCVTMSVGFIGKRKMVNGVPHIYAMEVLEGSFVGIPANPNALVSSAKRYADIEPPDGSYEARQEDICEALEELYPNSYVYLLATWSDHVVYCASSYPSLDTDGTYQVSYVVDATDEVQLSGEIVAVEIQQSVVPEKAAKYILRKSGSRNSTKDQSAIDQAHDLLVDAGANCPGMADDGKGMQPKHDELAKTFSGDVTKTSKTDETSSVTDFDLEAGLLEAELMLVDFDDAVADEQ